MKPDAAAGRSPVNELTRWVVLAGIAIMVWLAPTVAAAAWSTTGWRPGSKAASMFAAYAHLFAPQRIAGSGLAGGRFGWTVVGLFAAAIVVWSIPARSLGRRRRAVLRGLATRRDLRRFAPAEIVARSVTILGGRTKDPRRAGLLVGRDVYTGGEVWLSKESTLLVLAPPRRVSRRGRSRRR